MEEKESLEASALICQLPDPVQHQVHHLLPDGVVAPSVVVGGVLLPIDELLGVEKASVSSDSGLVNDGGLEVDEDSSGHVLAGPSLAEEG